MVDVVVIGGGHNGLVAAATLAKAGRKVVVLEGRDRFGGVADGVLHDTETLSADVVKTLGLDVQLTAAEPVFAPQLAGEGLVVSNEPGSSELGEDADAYRQWRAFLARVIPVTRAQLDARAPDLRDGARGNLMPLARAAMSVRRLGRKDMMELLRIGASCVGDTLAERFCSPLLQAVLAGPALHGTWMGPRSPTSTATLLLHAAQSDREVVGGPAALVAALEAACRSAGVELQAGARVGGIRVEGGAVVGVELEDGTAIDASVVLSAIGPRRTLLDLVPPTALPARLEAEISKVRTRGIEARIDLSLSAPLEFACRPGSTFGRVHIGEDPLDLERAFDHAKHRRMPTEMPLDLRQQVTDGGAVASILVRCAAYDLDGGWSDERRDALGQTVVSSLERYVPDLRERLTDVQTMTPADLESVYGLDGGHVMHGELALDQIGPLRPTLTLARHATAIPGLFLGSAGTHPGGGISGRPGMLAAQAILGK